MRTSVLVALAVAATAVGVVGCSEAERARQVYTDLETAIKIARDQVYPATVRVDARREEYVDGKKRRTGGNGSGVIFDEEGHILTNFHVAGRADELTVVLFSKERVKARLVGGDPWTDLAVIQIDLDEVKEKGLSFRHATFGDSDAIQEGESVLAIGSPFGLSRSISSGIISCSDRILGSGMPLPGGLETGLFNTWLQTDAAINPGNSGGPLVDLRGHVVGINTRGGGNDLSFAVPINVAKDVVRQILENGKVTRSTIGLALQPLQDLETFFDVGKTEGAIISSVEPVGPAAKAGILPQDILIEYDGEQVMGRYPEQLFYLRRRVSQTPAGAQVEAKIKRAGEVRTVTLVTEELTTVRSEEENLDKWGLVGQDITERLAQKEKLPDTRGVYVTGVRRGEPAQEAGVEDRDVILSVGTKEITNIEDLRREYKATLAAKQERVLLKVRRGQGVVPVLMKIDYAKGRKPAPQPRPKPKPEPSAEEPAPEKEGAPEKEPEAGKPPEPSDDSGAAGEPQASAARG
ncbi:MAG: trypsin-like peptidase domain-containing protein [Planctomycetes bacterium]|nr:trypsin-like peptidase domain-containing protein [Planctomycetota bacterium]